MPALLSPGCPANGCRTTRVYRRRRRPERSALYRLVQQHLETWPAASREVDPGVDIAPHQCDKLERLCRYVSRPPVAGERLPLNHVGCHHECRCVVRPYRKEPMPEHQWDLVRRRSRRRYAFADEDRTGRAIW